MSTRHRSGPETEGGARGGRRARTLAGAAGAVVAVLLASQASGEGGAEASPARAAMEQGSEALRRGQFERALESYRAALEIHAEASDAGQESRALSAIAQAQEAMGEYGKAARSLERALRLAEASGDDAWTASLLGALGNVYIALGPPEEAERHLERARALAQEAGDIELQAAIANNLGNHRAHAGQYAEALALHEAAAALASRAGDEALTAQAFANGARAALEQGDAGRAEKLAARASEPVGRLGPSHDSAYLRIHLARTYFHLSGRLPDASGALRRRAHHLLGEAHRMALALGDARASSYALGYLGELYEREGRTEEALELTRRAIFQAQLVDAPESLYRWNWQAGRLLHAAGRRAEAIEAYERAVSLLQDLRHRMVLGYGRAGTSFRDSAEPVYLQLVDLLLRSAAEATEPPRTQELLGRARDTVERLKAAELRDYFRDECVETLRAKLTPLEETSPSAIVLYPILLPDRTELLLSLPRGKMKRFEAPVGSAAVADEVGRLRYMLEKRTTREYLPHAQQLYDWLIGPVEEELASRPVDTLVFVPDGPLLTIPMAALHDGEHFLVEKYAVAITPGVELTDPRPLDRQAIKLLQGGLGRAVAGFPALRHVPGELRSVQRLHGGDVILDERFLSQALREHLGQQGLSVVHIATHARFDADVDEAFLLTFDGRLTMDELAEYVGLFRFRDTPLELLTLSACETAQGDERAALGLSGIAVKAGARSALGTLWKVNDAAASELVVEFYDQLRDSQVSRAAALQTAQAKLLGDLRYRHPGYWSAFVLINSWL